MFHPLGNGLKWGWFASVSFDGLHTAFRPFAHHSFDGLHTGHFKSARRISWLEGAIHNVTLLFNTSI